MINPIKVIKAIVNANVESKINPAKWDKYVRIDYDLDGDVFNYVNGLKSTIGNYAKKEGLKIDIYPASKEIEGNLISAGKNVGQSSSERVAVKVEDKYFGGSKIELFNSRLKNEQEGDSLAKQIFKMIGGSKKVGQSEAVEGFKEKIMHDFEKGFLGQ